MNFKLKIITLILFTSMIFSKPSQTEPVTSFLAVSGVITYVALGIFILGGGAYFIHKNILRDDNSDDLRVKMLLAKLAEDRARKKFNNKLHEASDSEYDDDDDDDE